MRIHQCIKYIIMIYLSLLWVDSIQAQYAGKYTKNNKGQTINRRKDALGSGGSQYSYKNGPDKSTGLYRSPNVGIHHFFAIWQDDAYSTMFTDIPQISLKPGGGAIGVGFGYEFQMDRLRFQVGLGIRWQDIANYVSDSTFYRNYARDSQGYIYNLRYDFRHRTDRTKNLYLNCPLMLGYGFAGFYMMAGAKFQYALAGSTAVRDTATTSGTYNQYLGHFVEMDNHGLRKEVPFYQAHMEGLHLKFDILASAEIGYEWILKQEFGSGLNITHDESRIRLALFADYGLLNINPDTKYSHIIVPEGPYQWDFDTFKRYHVISSTLTENKHVHNFFAGIRITFLVGRVKENGCILCTPFLSEGDFQ